MNILMVCMEDPWDILGGRGVAVREMSQALAKQGHEVTVACSGEKGGKIKGVRKVVSDKLICWKPRNANVSSLLAMDVQMFRSIAKLLATGERWDVVHVHDWDAVQTGRCIRDALEIPMVGSLHLSMTYLNRDGQATITDDLLYCMQQEAHLVADSDALIVSSAAYADLVRRHFMVERKVDVVPNGIDTKWWKANGTPRAENLALFVGRIAEMKGVREILEAVEAGTDYMVWLVGEVNANTEEEKESWPLTRKIRALEAEGKLSWMGFKDHKELRKLYSMATVGLMPSVHEPFGIAALEHMAMGVPLISSERGGLREIVVDKQGAEYALIIEPDPQQIRAALEMCKDEGVRKSLSAAGVKRAREFSWPAAAEKLVEIYRRVA